jgi:hypothetical protein
MKGGFHEVMFYLDKIASDASMECRGLSLAAVVARFPMVLRHLIAIDLTVTQLWAV